MRYFRVHFLCLFALFVPTVASPNSHAGISDFPTPQSTSVSEFEKDVINEINKARIEPTSIVSYLENREFLFRGLILYIPKRTPFLTVEGFPAVDEAISVLRKVPKAQSLRLSDGLVKVAKAQLADLLEKPELGHTGKDGSNLSRRLDRVGESGKASENITYTPITPREVTLNMIVDDGVKSRHHRANVLNPIFRLIGVGCGRYKNRRYICVIVFADKFVEGEPAKRIRKY